MRIILCLIILMFFLVRNGISQKGVNGGGEDPEELSSINSLPEEMPILLSCVKEETSYREQRNCSDKKLLELIFNKLKPPTQTDKMLFSSKIVCSFTIDIHGELKDPQMLRDINGLFEKEVFRILKELPKWKPAHQRGRAVEVRMNLPITLCFR